MHEIRHAHPAGALSQHWNNDAAALDAHLQSVQFGRDLTQAVVGVVETLNDARVRGIVETMSAQEQVETAERMGNLG